MSILWMLITVFSSSRLFYKNQIRSPVLPLCNRSKLYHIRKRSIVLIKSHLLQAERSISQKIKLNSRILINQMLILNQLVFRGPLFDFYAVIIFF